jgi:peptide/nickel transport system substrate-binding protein
MTNEWLDRDINRRGFLRWVGGGVAASAMLPLLAACGGDDDDDEPDAEATETTPAVAGGPTATTGVADSTATTGGDAEPTEAEGSPTTGTGGAPVTQGGQVSVIWRTPVSMSPLFSTAGSEQQVERLIFGALVKMNDALEPVPEMAETVEISEDASAYTFVLHEGVTFSDGQPLTTADVRFTLERGIDARTGSYWRGRLSNIAGSAEYSDQQADSVSGIETPDDRTVTINLTVPDAAFLVTLCNFSGLGILPMHVLQDVAPDQMQEHPFSLEPTVSAGAFKFVSYEADQFLELERNETYWGDPPPLDRIFMRILQTDVSLAQLETGELDIAVVPVSELERFQGVETVEVISVPSPSMDFLTINMELDYLQDKNLHKAMMHAIDREGIVDQLYSGEATVVNSPIFGPEWMGVPEGLDPYEYDPEKAQEYLAQSGWDTGRTIEILHVPVNAERDTAIQIIQEQWRAVGIQSEILQVDAAESNRRSIQSTDFEIRTVGGGVFRADPGVSGTYMTTRTWTPNGGNYGHYSNPQIDDLYEQAQAEADVEQRKALYTEIAVSLNDGLPWLFLYSPNSIYGVSNRVVGYAAPSYIDNKMWNAETWSVSES